MISSVLNNSSHQLYILFQIQESIYAISSEWVADIEASPETISCVSKAPPYVSGICNSFNRIITVISLAQLLDIPASEFQQMIILNNTPATGLLVEHIYGVETPENLRPMKAPAMTNGFIQNFFCHKSTDEVILELNVSKLLQQLQS